MRTNTTSRPARRARHLIGTVRAGRRLKWSAEYVRQLADRGVIPTAHRTLTGQRLFDVAVIERLAKARAKQLMAKAQVMAVNLAP